MKSSSVCDGQNTEGIFLISPPRESLKTNRQTTGSQEEEERVTI
jgi:hypothetical protein